MTKLQFQALPLLIFEHHVVAVTGYARNTIAKFTDCGVLTIVKPNGSGQGRFQSRQIAQMIGWDWKEVLREWIEQFQRENNLMLEKAVTRYTGYAEKTLLNIRKARGLDFLKPAGADAGRYRKEQIAELIGFKELV